MTASAIGVRYPRLEDKRLLTGNGRYIDDIRIPGLLHCAFLRSPHAHAAIHGIDTTALAAMPGVFAVLTLRDIEPVLAKRRMVREPGQGGKARENLWPHALADGEVAFVGQPIALLIAQNRYVAEDAAAKIEVEYQPLDVVSDARAAMTSGSPLVRRDLSTNIVNTLKVAYGEAEAAIRMADHIIREEFFIHRGSAHSLEGRGCVAEYVPATDGLVFWASTQKAHDLCQNLSAFLRIDETAMRVIAPDIGGGFGPKLCVYPEDVAVAAAAKLLKRPTEMGRGPARIFLSRRAGARPVLEHGNGAGSQWPHTRPARQAHPRSGRIRPAGRQSSLQFGFLRSPDPTSFRRSRWRSSIAHTNKVAGVVCTRRRISAGHLCD